MQGSVEYDIDIMFSKGVKHKKSKKVGNFVKQGGVLSFVCNFNYQRDFSRCTCRTEEHEDESYKCNYFISH